MQAIDSDTVNKRELLNNLQNVLASKKRIWYFPGNRQAFFIGNENN